MNTTTKESFNLVGIACRTTNENGQSSKDIPALWQEFMSRDLASKIPNKTGQDLYCAYTEYEKDHTKPYTTILGCAVSDLNDIPEGMTGITVDASKYEVFQAQGNLQEGAVFNEWLKIWTTEIPRAFMTDFEVYGVGAQNPEDAKVDIFVSVD
ncbi:MAG: GyrI-like domain-containing protein [Saprospiraceae bacterium]